MPVQYARRLTGRDRTVRANRQLGYALAFVAGATNAGGFLAVRQYTCHMTGMITDIGAEIGKLIYWNRRVPAGGAVAEVRADRARLRQLSTLVACFFIGGVIGALGFKNLGYVATVPLALFLVLLASVPAFDDLVALMRRF